MNFCEGRPQPWDLSPKSGQSGHVDRRDRSVYHHDLRPIYAMPTYQVERFADNWSYLRTELSWLDQILIAAIARQRKQTKEIDRTAQSKADRVSSHWWKGIISLEGNIAYDECRKPAADNGTPKLSYQQQLELRIRASQSTGILLALPLVRDRLGLSAFEKNLLVVCLAPEINRRYARMYRYLKGEEDAPQNDLPTVDLVLRLLCRNDTEWSNARRSLMPDAKLVSRGLLEVITRRDETLLNGTLRLQDALVDVLLRDRPSAEEVDRVLAAEDGPETAPENETRLTNSSPVTHGGNQFPWQDDRTAVPWSEVVLPDRLVQRFQQMSDRLRIQREGQVLRPDMGQLLWLTGPAGTGKRTVLRAIAHALGEPLTWIDAAQIEAVSETVQKLSSLAPQILAIQSAKHWFGRSHPEYRPALERFLAERRSTHTLTVLMGDRFESIGVHWRRQLPHLALPLPTASDRLRLWQIALGSVAEPFPWQWLADQFPLSGGTIAAIAYDATLIAAIDNTDLTVTHLLEALLNAQQPLRLSPASQAKYKLS